MVMRLSRAVCKTVRDLMPSMSLSCSSGVGFVAIQPPATRISDSTLRLKITSRAMPARFLVPVVEAAPSINGVMMLLSCGRVVVLPSYLRAHSRPVARAANAMAANTRAMARRRRFASLTSAGNRPLNGIRSPLIDVPSSKCALRHGDHVTGLYRIVVGEVALLEDLLQANRVRRGRSAFAVAIELRAVGGRKFGGAAGGKYRVEYGHALPVGNGDGAAHRAGHPDAREVFVAAQGGKDYRYLRITD